MDRRDRIKEGVIVAAGLGSRLQPLRPGGELIKPLEPVGGIPILRRVLEAGFAAGLEDLVLVTGHMGDELQAAVSAWPLAGRVRFVFNARFRLANGVSLYEGARRCAGDFALLMSDHLFQLSNLEGLLDEGLDGRGAVLAVDRKLDRIFDMADATKVVVEGSRIVEIGKELVSYNAVDTGMFLISREIVDLLGRFIDSRGDASISQGMARFIAAGRMGAFDVGDGMWQDVDTPEMLTHAERLVTEGVF